MPCQNTRQDAQKEIYSGGNKVYCIRHFMFYSTWPNDKQVGQCSAIKVVVVVDIHVTLDTTKIRLFIISPFGDCLCKRMVLDHSCAPEKPFLKSLSNGHQRERRKEDLTNPPGRELYTEAKVQVLNLNLELASQLAKDREEWKNFADALWSNQSPKIQIPKY